MIVLNGMPFIRYSLEAIYHTAWEIIIIEGAVQKCLFTANKDGSSIDGTVDFIKNYPDPLKKIRLVQGIWPEKCEMQNKALEFVTGDYVWLVDSDEVYCDKDIAKIKELVTKDPNITQINFFCYNFWKGFDHIFVSNKLFTPTFQIRRIFKYQLGSRFISHRPPTMVYPGTEKTTEQMNCLTGMETWRNGMAIYHYSYVLDGQVKQKMELYRRYGWDKNWGIDIQRWYKDCYSQWTPARRLELERRYPIWTGDKASFSVPFKGEHPEVIADDTKRNSEMHGPSARPFAMMHVVDAIEELLFNNLPGPPIVALETGTIRSYDEKRESTRHISSVLGRGGRLISVDISPKSIRISRDICKDADNVEWVLFDALSFLRKSCPATLNFVLLDSVNDSETIFSEFALVAPHMAINGIIIIDDAGIRTNGSGHDSSAAQKGHLVWQFLNECGAKFDVLETVSGHSTQIKVRFTPENSRKILDRIPSWTEQKTNQPASRRPALRNLESAGNVMDSKAILSGGVKRTSPDPHIVIDGVIFQLQAGRPHGISRVWRNLIQRLMQQMPSARISVLQREGFPLPVLDTAIHNVPTFELGDHQCMDADDEMLRCVCRDLQADVFVSTYYTRAPGVFNVVMIHDMIPELFGYDLSQPEWLAKQRVIETGDAFICVSRVTRDDLTRCYPQIETSPMVVVPNGLDACFKSADQANVLELRKKFGLAKGYVLLVGNRRGYKEGRELLKALSRLPSKKDFTVLCVGGERQPSPEELRIKNKLDLRYAGHLTDSELAAAYSGAQALLFPSKYEGFGLPVLEAMACGCPVIAEKTPAVAEVGGDAVCFADLSCSDSVRQALQKVSEPAFREEMTDKGRARAARFNWDKAAEKIGQFIRALKDKPSILLTAVVSTYNAAKFIKGCLEDLEHQTIADRLEIIVVDSASKEGEAAIVKGFQKRYANIKYIRTKDRESVYQAWNRGIKFALGQYVSNANTDDRHRRDAFEQMVRVLEADDNIALVYADVVKTRTANETFSNCTPTGFLRWPDWDRRALLEKGCFIGPQPMWRRKVHETYGYFNERYRTSSDYDFWLRISQTNDFYHIPETLGLYLEREDSIEHSDSKLKQREDRDIISTYANASAQGRIIGMAACKSTQNDLSRTDASYNNKHKTGLSAEGVIPVNKGSAQGEPFMQLKETILKSIENLIENDHKEAACWVMDKMLLDYPDSPELNSQRAGMAFEQGDMDKALHHFKSAAELAPQNAPIQRQVGDFFYVVEKDAQRALTQYAKVLAIVPDDVETLMLAGHLSMSLHQYQEAKKYYKHVLQVDPENKDVQQFLDKLGDPPTASQDNGMSVDELYASAQANAQNDDRQSAIQLLEQVLVKEPEHPQGHNDLGVLYYESGDMEKAQTHYEQATRLQPENEIFQKNLADFYWVALADPEKAMQQYVQVLKLNPQDVESLLGCVQICMALNRTEDAREFLEVALSIEPWNDNVIQLREQLENGTEIVGPVNDSNDLYEQAKHKAASGDLEGAIHDLTQVLVHSPDESKYHNELGILYYESGQKEKALASYEQAVRLEPSEHNYAKNLADYYLVEQGRVEDAMKLYLQVLESNPEDIEALMATGLVCASIGHTKDAKHFYDRVLELEPWNQEAQKAIENILKHVNQEENQVERKTAAG